MTPVAVFAFNRPESLRASLDALGKNPQAPETDLFVFIDGPKNESDREKIEMVKAVVGEISGFRSVEVNLSESNRGLGPSIIRGVSEVIERYGRVIVLEDDLVVTPDFLAWMNACLDKYEGNPDVFSVCGYTNKVAVPSDYPFDGYFATRSASWGWATWKDRWNTVDWNPSREEIRSHSRAFNRWGGSDCAKMLMDWRDGRNTSWAIRFCFSEFLQGKLSIFPVLSRVDPSLGFTGDGTNCKRYSRFKWELFSGQKGNLNLPENVHVSPGILRSALRYHSLLLRAWSRFMYLIYR